MKAVTEFGFILSCILILRFGLERVHGLTDLEDFKRMTAPTRKRCIAETKTTLQAVEDTEYGQFPEDDRLKCYFKCALQRFGMMDATGKIQYNLLKKVVPDPFKDVFNEMIDSCTEETGKDNCDKAFNFMKCMFYVNPTAFRTP
ncbi:odorant binding protein 11 [Halictus rubicundus]|uniref:odorant binding protein 11 n=1 Tax=Halictus rubicundus TaxID=77578 RepID=UPI00403656B5